MLNLAEIGLNHLGKYKYLDTYLDKLSCEMVDGISIQVLDDSFYRGKYKKFRLSDKKIIQIINQIKKKNKLVGIVTNSVKRMDFLKKLKIDFYKVLSTDIFNIELIKKIIKTNCKIIFLSTGMVDYKKLKNILNKINRRKISLIHTSFKKNKEDINLKRINILKKKYKLPVSYGNHSRYLKSLVYVKKFNPFAIFFYVKLDKNLKYPDNIHAIRIDKLKNYIC